MGRWWLALAASLPLLADARYELAYDAKTNPLLGLVASLAGLSKLASPGEAVLLKGNRVMVKGQKQTIVVNYGTGRMLLIDHTDRTWEDLPIEEMRQRVAADIPEVLQRGLRRLFPEGNGGTATTAIVERSSDPEARPSLERFRQRHGLGYLFPGMESIISLTPAVASEIAKLRQAGVLVEAIRILVGENGKLVNAFVEIRNYRESPVEEEEMRPPANYAQIK